MRDAFKAVLHVPIDILDTARVGRAQAGVAAKMDKGGDSGARGGADAEAEDALPELSKDRKPVEPWRLSRSRVRKQDSLAKMFDNLINEN